MKNQLGYETGHKWDILGGEAETGLGSDLSHVAVGVMKKSNLYKMAWF